MGNLHIVIGVFILAIICLLVGWNCKKIWESIRYRSRQNNIHNSSYRTSSSIHRPLPHISSYSSVAGTRALPRLSNSIQDNRVPVRATTNPSLHNVSARDVCNFPKCPVCRRRNYNEQTQHIFWLDTRNCFRCDNNHYFNKRGNLV